MIPPRRRGVCPSLAAPMATGDGLLARITPTGATIPLDSMAALSAAARRHGNGIIEVTSRGSIQIRGLTAASAPAFAEAVTAIDLEMIDGVPVVVNPLAGLEAREAIDASALAAKLREAIRAAELNGRLAPKVSITVDGGGALHLDALAADVRLRAETEPNNPRIHLSLGGDAASAMHIGVVSPSNAVEAAVRLLAVIAARGPAARARSVVKAEGVDPFSAAVADLVTASPAAPARARSETISAHPLRDGRIALGIGLAFGHTGADTLERLIEAARRAQACGFRTAPDRALLVIGVAPERAGALVGAAEELGFMTRAEDPRRSITACPGAPFCACTETPTRALAPSAAVAIASMLDGSVSVHLSGCVKGCAHPGAALLTIVGGTNGCGIIVDGTAQAQPLVTMPVEALMPALARLGRAVVAACQPNERSAATLSRLGAAQIASILAERHDG
ncbi:MAG: precorrin-3B synthase [Rhodoplanes sp.]